MIFKYVYLWGSFYYQIVYKYQCGVLSCHSLSSHDSTCRQGLTMDFQHRAGGKTGTGGVASFSDANRDRRERLRQLALDTIDLNKDPYFMKNHLGTYECKLCLTLHNNEGSYLAHTQGNLCSVIFYSLDLQYSK